jgi:hypothetical protein
MLKFLALPLLTMVCVPVFTLAQTAGGPPKSAKQGASIDLTGNWVSIVTEDYRWRMVTPLKGDAASVPINAAARKVVDAWDPAKDEAAGLQCKSYGAAAIMRVPGRLRITWQDDNTLKIEADAGTQTRLFHFDGKPPEGAKPSWQGYSAAKWSVAVPPGYAGASLGMSPRQTESRDDQSEPGLFAQERCSLQRSHDRHGVLRSFSGIERRRMVHGHHGR